MIIGGLLLILLGWLLGIGILVTLGVILLVIGLIFLVLGHTGHAVGGRRYWW